MQCTKKGQRKGDEWLLQFLSFDRDTGTGPQGGELTSYTFGAWAKLQYLLQYMVGKVCMGGGGKLKGDTKVGYSGRGSLFSEKTLLFSESQE